MEVSEWFSVDKEGLAALLADRGKWFAVYELWSNAADESTSHVEIDLRSIDDELATLRVTDDNPEGFADLSHAYTLFAPSAKKADASKRGRFNLGEKLVLAICDEAEIRTTSGTVHFGPEGRTFDAADRTSKGSVFEARIRMTRAEVDETHGRVRTIMPTWGVTTTYNGEELEPRAHRHSFIATLGTVKEDEAGVLRRVYRSTTIRVHEPRPGEVPMIYELGVPVVETGDRWHVDVQQKVPLNMDRDNVPPAWLAKVRSLVLSEMAEQVTEEEAGSTWVREAIAHPDTSDAAVELMMDKRFGEKRVAFDPSDPEANKRAMAAGYTVVTGGAMGREEWAAAKRVGAMIPAGQVTPSAKILESAGGTDYSIPAESWTEGMRAVAAYAQALGEFLLGSAPSVRIVRRGPATGMPFGQYAAAYGSGRLTFNLGSLGHRWFDAPDQEAVDALLIHEFGHHFCGDHLSERFHDALCKMGARMRYVNFGVANPRLLHEGAGR